MVATPFSPDAGARRRIVVTAVDVVTPIGFDLDSFWKAAQAGASGVRRITHFDPEGLPTQIAATLADPALIEGFRAEAELGAREPRSVVVGVRAARGAVRAAAARVVLASPRAGVFVGTGGERHDLRDLGEFAYASRRETGQVTPASFAQEFTRRLAREEALFGGTSSGANVVAALRVAKRLGAGGTVVTLLCDSGLKYLSTDLYA